MYSHFIKSMFALIALLISLRTYAGSELVLTSTGKDLGEAQVRALRQAVLQTNVAEKILLKTVLEPEIVPYAPQFIASYRVQETGAGGSISIQANVDVDLLRSLVALSPKTMGTDEKMPKVLLITRAPKLSSGKEDLSYTNAFGKISEDRFARRGFQLVRPQGAMADHVLLSDEILSTEFMQPMGQKLGAALVLAVSVSLGQVENENSHNMEDRIYFDGALVDVKKNVVLSHHKSSATAPQGRREAVEGILQRVVADRGDELVQELLVRGGESFLRQAPDAGGLMIRILEPQSATLLNQFRVALEAQRDIRAVVDRSVRRGAYDFKVETSLSPSLLAQKLKVLATEAFSIQLDTTTLGKDYDLALRLIKKTENTPAPAAPQK